MSEATGATQVQYPPPLPPQPTPTWAPPPRRPRPTLPLLSPEKAGWLIVAGVLTDLSLRSGIASLASALAVLVIVGPLLGSEFGRTRTATGFAIAATVFAIWLPMRASTWLTSLNAVTVAICLLAAAATTRAVPIVLSTNALFTVSGRVLNARFFGSVVGGALAPLRSLGGSRLLPLIRGAALAVIPVAVLAGLLASADAVFAQSFDLDIAPAGFFEHGFLSAFAVLVLAGLIAITSEPVEESFSDRRPLGATEALVLLGSIGALYAAFAIVQLLSALGRADDILAEQGLTYAEYARNGFFQLLWVAGLTAVLLGVVRLLVTDGATRVNDAARLAGAMVAALTLIIVVVAIVRLGLYTDEFGQTTLRWYSNAFAWMLGIVFVVIAVGHHRHVEKLLPLAVLAIVGATLFTVNVLNPEARVASHNLNRPDAAESLDTRYLTRLSADAWPELLDHSALVESRSSGIGTLARRCAEANEPNGYGIFGFNLAKHQLNCDS